MKIRLRYLVQVMGVVAVYLLVPQAAQAGARPAVVSQVAARAFEQKQAELSARGELGEPTPPTVTQLGCTQTYRDDGRETTLMAPGCGSRVVVVQPEIWRVVEELDPLTIGMPLSEADQTEVGSTQVFSGGSLGTVAVVATPASSFVVPEPFWSYYSQLDHRTNLGQPIGDAFDWQGERRQDFEHGVLVWRAEVGVRQLPQLPSGQLVHSASYSASAFLLQGEQALEYREAEQLQRCQSGQPITELSRDNLELTLKTHPVQGIAPACQTAAEVRAVAWVSAERSSPAPAWSDQLGAWWSGRCETFVELAYGVRGRAASAFTHYQYRLQRGAMHTDASPPAGAFVFYAGADGHVGISIGNGYVISTQGYSGQRSPVWQHRVTGLSNQYLGWAYYDGTWPR